MAFGEQQIFPIDFNESAAVGINLPFNGPAVFQSNYQTKDVIKTNLINFFLTNPGERFLNPSFGGGLRSFIFEQITNGNTNFLTRDIETKLNVFFPTIKVENLEVIKFEDNNTIQIKLKYSIINTNINDNLEIEFI